MKHKLLMVLCFVVSLISILLISARLFAQTAKSSHSHSHSANTLPSSLDNFYPPKNEQPIYLFKMMGMSTPFSGCFADLFENDFDNAMANFEKFKAEYQSVAMLIPEWEKDFPMAPVKELEAALKSSEQGKVMAAAQKVGRVCHNCHVTKMPLAQFKYHWKDFRTIEVTDPLSQQKVSFAQLMQFMQGSFTGTMVDMQQNQKQNAQKQFQGFSARFQAMKKSCKLCHSTERYYYVDESIESKIKKLGKTIESPSPDPQLIQQLGQEIGTESCLKCHKVHIPAAFAKIQWQSR